MEKPNMNLRAIKSGLTIENKIIPTEILVKIVNYLENDLKAYKSLNSSCGAFFSITKENMEKAKQKAKEENLLANLQLNRIEQKKNINPQGFEIDMAALENAYTVMHTVANKTEVIQKAKNYLEKVKSYSHGSHAWENPSMTRDEWLLSYGQTIFSFLWEIRESELTTGEDYKHIKKIVKNTVNGIKTLESIQESKNFIKDITSKDYYKNFQNVLEAYKSKVAENGNHKNNRCVIG